MLGLVIGVAFLARSLKQPLLVSYLVAGILAGPLFFNLINSNLDFFDVFAEFGVVLLLFLVGLSLNINYLKKIGKVAVVTGVGQVVFTSTLGFLIIYALGFSFWSSLFIAISITFSSTIIITKLLSEKRDERSVYGRYTIGLMLVQDIIAIAIMVLLPALQFGDSLAIELGLLIVKTLFFFSILFLVTRFLLPKVLSRAAESGEFLLIFTLAWCFAVAGASEWAGISLEVGAIVAGLTLAASKYQTEISSRVRPLRDFFIALFFIILGSEMRVESIQSIWFPGLLISLFILIGNPLILYFLYRRMRFTRRNSFLAGLTAAQVSEFGFVFLYVSRDTGIIDGNELSIFTLVALITISASSYLITYNYWIYKKIKPVFHIFFKRDKIKAPQEAKEHYDVLVFGYHRLGWKVCDALKEMGVDFAVVDFDPVVIDRLKKRGLPYLFGDASDVEFLDDILSQQVKMVISTLPNAEDQMVLLRHLRKFSKRTVFIGNLSHTRFLSELYTYGADYVMVPHLMGGSWIAEVLKRRKWTRASFKELTKDQKNEIKPLTELLNGKR